MKVEVSKNETALPDPHPAINHNQDKPELATANSTSLMIEIASTNAVTLPEHERGTSVYMQHLRLAACVTLWTHPLRGCS